MAKIESGHDPDKIPAKYRAMNDRLTKSAKLTRPQTISIVFITYLNSLAFNISI